MKHARQYPAWLALIFCALLSPHAPAQSAPPPLKPNEKVVTTKDGCGFVVDESKPSAKFESERIAKLTWGGPCVNGLAMGEGWVFEGDFRYLDVPPRKGWLWYGRGIGPTAYTVGSGPTSFAFTWDSRTISYNTLSTTNPVWVENRSDFARRSRVSDGTIMVTTSSRGCILERKSFPECERENKFDIPGVQVFNLEAKTNQFHACPNPRSAQGCEALWAQHAGPVLERVKAFIAENTPKVTTAKREVMPLIAHWRPSPGSQQAIAARHAAIRAEHLAEREKREAEQARKQREHDQRMKQLDAQIAAQRAENERLQAIADQERKEARRRDRREAMGVLRSYSNSSAAMGNNKPANRLSRVEELTRKPAEGETRVSTALNRYADNLARRADASSPPAANPTRTGSPTPPTSSSNGGSGSSREFPVAALTNCVKVSFLPSSLGRRYYQLSNACSVEIICSANTFIDGKKRHYDGMGCGYGLAPGHRVKHPYGITASGSLSAQVEWACPSKAVVEQQIGKKISGIGWRTGRGCVAMHKHEPVGTGR